MTDRPEDQPEQPPPQPEDAQLGRRMFLFKAGALLGIAATTTTAATIAATTPAEAQRRGRYYTGRTDRDPYDRAGRGIRRGYRRRRWRTDRDPYDRVGRGIR